MLRIIAVRSMREAGEEALRGSLPWDEYYHRIEAALASDANEPAEEANERERRYARIRGRNRG